MLTSDKIIEYALSYVIGMAFSDFTNSIVQDIFVPLIITLFDYKSIYIQNGYGYTILTSPNNTHVQYASGVIAQMQGAQVILWSNFANSLLNFIIILILSYYITLLKISFIRGVRGVRGVNKITKSCAYCFSEIDIKASRCLHCTTWMSVSEEV